MKTINVTTGDNAYAGIIGQYFERKFSASFQPSKDNLLDILTDILVGTKEYRFGPLPRPEILAIIRQTIQKAIELGEPIPITVPWGGRKARSGVSVDIAEVSALRQLVCMDTILRKYYEPGILVHIRIEDTGADWLYRDESSAPEQVERYSADMIQLIHALRGDSKMDAIRESELMDTADYFEMANMYSAVIFDYLSAQEHYPVSKAFVDAALRMQQIGWIGVINEEQRQYYKDRYTAQEPDLPLSAQLSKMADYFAGSLARYKLNGRANPETPVGSFIQINFVPPVPGAPAAIFSNTLYYRTVALSNARTHIAPWRAKGYLEIDGSGGVKSKITSFGDKQRLSELLPGRVQLCTDGGPGVEVCADSFISEVTPAWAAGFIPVF